MYCVECLIQRKQEHILTFAHQISSILDNNRKFIIHLFIHITILQRKKGILKIFYGIQFIGHQKTNENFTKSIKNSTSSYKSFS